MTTENVSAVGAAPGIKELISRIENPERPIKIIYLEDIREDAALAANQLKKSQPDVDLLVVETREKFITALQQFVPDIILINPDLTSFRAAEAFSTLKENGSCIPWILVTARNKDSVETDAILNGAADIIFKDELHKLSAAIQHALEKYRMNLLKELIADELTKSETHLKQIESFAHLGSFYFDYTTGTSVWSEELLNIYGLATEDDQRSFTSWTSYIHPEDRDDVLQKINEAKAHVTNADYFHRIIRKDGTIRHLHCRLKSKLNSAGLATGIYVTTQDVTEKARAEESLKTSEANLQAIFENTSEGFILLDPSGVIRSFNRKARERILLSTDKEIAVGKPIYEFLPPARQLLYKEHMSKVLAGEVEQYDHDFTTKSGEVIWCSFLISPVYNAGKMEGISFALTDITERKNAEEAIKESEAKFHKAFRSGPDAIAVSSVASGKLLDINDSFTRIFGFTREETIGRTALEAGLIQEEWTRSEKISSLQNNEPVSGREMILWDKNSQPHIVSVSSQLISWNKEESMLTVVRDITKQKKTEDELIFSEQKLRMIFSSASDTIFLLSVEPGNRFQFKSMNAAGLKAMGMTEQQVVNKYVDEIIPPGSLEIVLEKYQEAIQHKKTVHWEEVSDYPSGVKTGIVSVTPVFDDKGTCLWLVGTVNDISERKNAEENLAQSEHRLRTILETEPECILQLGRHEKLIYINPAGLAMIEADTVPDLENLSLTDLISPEYRPLFKTLTEEVFSGGSRILQFEMNGLKGTHRWLEIHAVPFKNSAGEITSLLGITRDITAQKNLEKALIHERDQFFAMFSKAPSAIGMLKGPDHVFVMANPLYTQLTGKQNLIGRTVAEALPEVVEQGFVAMLDGVYHTGEPFIGEELLVKIDTKGDGEFTDFYISFIYQAYRNTTGEIEGVFFFINNVTEQILSRKELEKSEKFFKTVIDSSVDMITIIDPDGKTIYASPAVSKTFGYTMEECLSLNNADIVHPDDSLVMQELIGKVMMNPGVPMETPAVRDRKKDGTYIWVEGTLTNFIGTEGINAIVANFRDVTERKKASEELYALNLQLLKNVNDLAVSNRELEDFAYVASHDLQEPLRMVTGFLKLVEQRYSDVIDAKGKQYIHYAVDGAKRMQQIILDLLEFSRVGKVNEKEEQVDLNQIVNEVIYLCQNQIIDTKAVVNSGKLPTLPMYKIPLRQVFQNLISNALKYHKEDEAPVINISAEEQATYWQVSVSDNGIGIDKEYFDQIFVIFKRLHNKDQYSGTGIGLAVCKKIIENFGGKIWLSSGENQGSTFYFTIPKS
ncbi:MAG: sensor signal transduction histidine kinase [Ferruginibacter sp.]|nr:sensor signal transduction histidine kinase [Ferruginibacter sp.]